MPTFDGDNLVIILDSGITTVDVEADLYSEWKEWFLLSNNSKYPPAFRTSGGDPLTPGIDAGAYFFLRNDLGWRIRPPEENITIYIVGNLAPEDSELDVLIPTTGAFTTAIFGLQPITQKVDQLLELQNEALYGGQVHIDTLAGTAGTVYPIGTASEPVSNIADAIIIANSYGFRRFTVRGSITLAQPMPFCIFEGVGGVALVDINNQNISGASFTQMGIQGIFPTNLTVPPLFYRCTIMDGVQNFIGSAQQMALAGNISLGSGNILIADVASTELDVTFDFQGNDTTLVIRSARGHLSFENITHPSSSLVISATAILVYVHSTCTNGSVIIRGEGVFTDDSTGSMVVDKTSFLEVDQINLKLDTLQTSLTTLAGAVIAADLLVAPGSTATEIRTAATQASGFYDGLICVVSNLAGTVARTITVYSQTNGAFTLDTALPFTPSVSDRFVVLGRVASAAAAVDNTAIAIAVWARSVLSPTAGSYGELMNKVDRKTSFIQTMVI